MRVSTNIFIPILAAMFCSCNSLSEEQAYADQIIQKAEQFKATKGRFPKDTKELGLTERMDSPAYYQLENDTSYIVWYGLTLGESMTYKSITERWE